MDADIHEIREKLDELSEQVKENTRMTKSIYRRAKWASFFVIVKWLVIAAIAIGSLYYIQPYLETILKMYSSISGMTQGGSSAAASSGSILDILKSL